MTDPDVEYRRMKIRRGTAAEWTVLNTLLAEGEEGFETDTRLRKVGDGVTYWIDLLYDGDHEHLGSAAFADTGISTGQLPLLNSDARFDPSLVGAASGDPALFLNGVGVFAPPITSLTPAFTTPSLGSGASNPSGSAPIRYTKDALGFVHVEGVVGWTGTGVTVFTLPSGFRPSATVRHFVGTTASNGNILATVTSAGVVATSGGIGGTAYTADVSFVFYADA